jgi:hypothetical protein
VNQRYKGFWRELASLRFQRCSTLSAWNVCACHGSSENANERSATWAPDALSAIANCRSCSNSRCSWPMTKAYGSSARSVPGQLRARGFSVNRGNAQAFEDREDRCGHALEARSDSGWPTAARTAISRPRASREYRRAGCTAALWKGSRRAYGFCRPSRTDHFQQPGNG